MPEQPNPEQTMIAADKGSGRPLVLVHGFSVDHRLLCALEPVLETTGWRRIYIDLPWTEGGLNRDLSTSQAVADALVETLRDHLGEEPFAILGNSFGGMLARHVAHVMGEQVLGLATLAAVFVADSSQRRLPERRVLHDDPAVLEAAGEAREDFEEMTVIRTRAMLDSFLRHSFPGIRTADQRVMAAISDSYALEAVPEQAHDGPFDRPALHVFGRQDHVAGFEDGLAWQEHYVRGTFAVLDGAGHSVHLEQPALVGALLTEWLERMDRSVSDGR